MSQKNKFLKIVAIAKTKHGWTKTELIKQAKLSPSQVRNMSQKADAIYSCRQPTRDNIAKAVGIDVAYLNDTNIPVEDYEKYVTESTADKPNTPNPNEPVKKSAPRKKNATSKTAKSKSAPVEQDDPAKPSQSTELAVQQLICSPTARLDRHLSVLSQMNQMLKEFTGSGGSIDEFMDSVKQFATLVVKPGAITENDH